MNKFFDVIGIAEKKRKCVIDSIFVKCATECVEGYKLVQNESPQTSWSKCEKQCKKFINFENKPK